MTERWNVSSALRGGVGAGTVVGGGGGGSNGGSNGIGNGAEFGVVAGDGRSGGTTFSAANGESGILRKTGHYHHHGGAPENFDDLLVFGYSCKVFRDDERARFIDQGRHLIPWMGDNQLKIDRYDARGALHDLSPYEPPPGGYQNRLEGLTAAEQKAEQLCEEERYYSLYNNEVEEEYYQEESLKRQKLLGNQVPFNYDAPQPPEGAIVATVEDRAPNSADEQDDNPYEPPKNFEIPPDITLPDTMKEHAIIEKTAKFIASQDAQMEILLKTKQANNPQFEFLTQGARLFRYYRHVLLAFRTNQYPTEADQAGEDETMLGDAEVDGDAYLAAQVRPKIIVPAIKYKPSVDCAYTQLISKITGAPIPTILADVVADSQAEAPMSAQQLTSLNTEFDYYPESTISSASAVEVKKVSTGLAGLVQYDSESSGSDDDDDNECQQKGDGGKQAKNFGPFEGVMPPVTIQHVIDRTAIYVAKNGYSFEEALRVKNDPRFVFLNQAHEYYPYYAYLVRHRMAGGGEETIRLQQPASPSKVTIRTETENGTVVETTPSLGIKAVHTAVPKVIPAPVTNIQHQKLGAPVSFSLVVRKAKEEGGAPVKTRPGLGGSEDEEEVEDGENQEGNNNKQSQPEAAIENGPTVDGPTENDADRKEVPTTANTTTEDIASELLDETVEAFEISSLPIVSDSATIPEPSISKEKQAERKKRANMFVNLIKQQPKVVDAEDTCGEKKPTTDEKSAKATSANNSDGEAGSIHSVHSRSPSPKQQSMVRPTTGLSICISTTVIDDDDDDDDDVVLVSETRPVPERSRSRHTRSHSKHEAGERRAKKKKSKSRHRSARGKKKSKKKSGSRSRSGSREHSKRSGSLVSRSRKRHSRSRRGDDRVTSRSSSRSRSTVDSTTSRRSKRRSVSSRHSSLTNRVKQTAKRSKRTSRSRSRTPEVRRSSKRAPSTERKRRKETRRSREPSQTKKRKRRSRSRSSGGKNGSDAENRHRHRKQRRGAGDGHDGYDERYPPTRGRYWDC